MLSLLVGGDGSGLAVKAQATLFWNGEVGGGALGILRSQCPQPPHRARPSNRAGPGRLDFWEVSTGGRSLAQHHHPQPDLPRAVEPPPGGAQEQPRPRGSKSCSLSIDVSGKFQYQMLCGSLEKGPCSLLSTPQPLGETPGSGYGPSTFPPVSEIEKWRVGR